MFKIIMNNYSGKKTTTDFLITFTLFFSLFFFNACQTDKKEKPQQKIAEDIPMCYTAGKGNHVINESAMKEIAEMKVDPAQLADFTGMVRLKGGAFDMGGDMRKEENITQAGMQPRPDEFPKHGVEINDFWIDETEVTNAQFAEFVAATGYITTAERPIPLEEIMAQLPEGAEPPSEDMLAPASLVFVSPEDRNAENLGVNDWWKIEKGASWKHPQGKNSSSKGQENLPVVHISWYDAMAYAKWAGKRLPTEAEWEYAARGGQATKVFPWGDDFEEGLSKANFWQGDFPVTNTVEDGYIKLAPVKSFAPNSYGLYDMAGNVWEWCNDWYRSDYYECLAQEKTSTNPSGPPNSFDPYMPYAAQKIIRGGSFLCNDSYCSGYRVAARMKSSPDTGLEHTGFRCVRDTK